MPEPARIIRWEEPPPARGNVRPAPRTGSRWDKVAVELISRHGRAAVIHECVSRNTANNLAHRVRRGEVSCFAPAGDFGATVRASGAVNCVYAWYIGEEDSA